MEPFFNFAREHWFIALLMLLIVAAAAKTVIVAPFKYSFMAYNRSVRARNIAAHGWPTAPVDADGDVVYPKPEEEK